MTYRFRDIGVQMSPLILGATRTLAIGPFRLSYSIGSLDIDFIVGSLLVGLMEALHQQ